MSLCHCLACQKRTGSTYGIAAFFRNGDVSVHGRSSVFTRLGRERISGDLPLLSRLRLDGVLETATRARADRVAAGAFADPNFPKPANAVHLETRHPWVRDL